MSINLILENETDPVVWRGPVIAGAVTQFWSEVLWDDVDYMFVDMPPGTGDVPLTVFQSLPVDGIIIVTSPQELVGMIVGLNKARLHGGVKAVCQVGMGPETPALEGIARKKNFLPFKKVPVFYFQGAFNLNKLPLPLKLIMEAYQAKDEPWVGKMRHRAIVWSCPAHYYANFSNWAANCWGIDILVEMESLNFTKHLETSDKEEAMRDLARLYERMVMSLVMMRI